MPGAARHPHISADYLKLKEMNPSTTSSTLGQPEDRDIKSTKEELQI
jgi:hypothetical protein